jgi:tetratricopeptide (TPR) repeat protein
VAAARGFVALQRGDKPAALELFETAISLGERRGPVLLERAMLLRETGAQAAKVRAALVEAVEASPALAEGWHLLSNMAAAAGDKEEAIRTAEKAAAILPRQSIFWESLGRAYLAAGRAVDAANAAAKAVVSARNDKELKLAEGLKKDAAAWRPPEPPKAQRSWYQIPDGWQGPKPDTGISGRLVDVACGTNSLLFTVETAPKQRTVLRAADPSKIFLRQEGGEKREFVCGAQKPVLLVEAGYRAAPDRVSKTAGELIVLAIQGVEAPPPAPPPAAKKKPAPSKKAPAKKK